MLNVRICKDDADVKAGIGKVLAIDIPETNIAEALVKAGYPQSEVDKLTSYGYRVFLQKNIGESKDWKGRSFEAVEKHLTNMSIPFTTNDWEKGKAAETSLEATKEQMAAALGVNPADITDEQATAFRARVAEMRKARLAKEKAEAK